MDILSGRLPSFTPRRIVPSLFNTERKKRIKAHEPINIQFGLRFILKAIFTRTKVPFLPIDIQIEFAPQRINLLFFFSLPAVAQCHIISIEGIKFLTNVTITDLDPKTLQHVQRKYLGQLRESAVAYREFLSKIKR